jgi:hypothetical protein
LKVFFGVAWIADRLVYVIPMLERKSYLYKSKLKIKVANTLRKKFPIIKNSIIKKSNDIYLNDPDNKYYIAATHPRPYNLYIYDYLKSDIVVLNKDLTKAISELNKLKKVDIKRKMQLNTKLKLIKPVLEKLYNEGIVDGFVGRGSYFEKNGFPNKKDDIDILLLINKYYDKEQFLEVENKIINILKNSKGKFSITFTRRNESFLKKSKSGPEFSFIIITQNTKSFGIFYEKYILKNCVGIPIKNLNAIESEKLAKYMLKFLSVDQRLNLIKKEKHILFPTSKNKRKE